MDNALASKTAISKMLKLLLVTLLVFSFLPITNRTAFAAEQEAATAESTTEKPLSSYTWFEHQGSAGAIAVLEDSSLKNGIARNDAIDLGGVHDATSLQNMKASIQYLKECNELRAQHGLDPLLVSDTMMAIAQSQLDASRTNGGNHSLLYGVAENLASGYSGTLSPFAGWYTYEKNLYDKDPVANRSKAGHYFTIINPEWKYTGFAVITDPGAAKHSAYHNQVFTDNWIPVKGDAIKSYTVEEYEALFMSWYAENVFTCPDCGAEYAGDHVCTTYTCEACGETYKGTGHVCATQTCPDCGVKYAGSHECETVEPDPEPSVCPECGLEHEGEHECQAGGGEGEDPEPVVLAAENVTLSAASYVYDAKVKTPAVSVSHDGKALAEGVDYEASYDSGRKRSGVYGVTVTGIGDYAGSVTKSFEIVDAKLSSSDVALSYATAAYNGSAKNPTATVKVNGVKQLASEYNVTYWNKAKTKQVSPVLVGTYWVKIEAKDAANTTGTVWKKLTVNPKATANLKLTALNNGFKATWTKRAVQVTGYQVAYRQVGTSAWKTKTVTSCKTNFKSVTGLKDKKSYQVKVRTFKTVGGVKYYSAYTPVKTIRTR